MSTPSRTAETARMPGTRLSRIMIVEDHPLMQEGIAKWVNEDDQLEVCGKFENASEALQAIEILRPDLVLCDISLSGRNGLEFVKDAKVFDPGLPVVMLSMHEESMYALRCIRAGARGYVMKKAGGAEVVAAIKQVLAGGTALSSNMAGTLIEEFSGRKRTGNSPLAALTDREFEVLMLLGEGKTTKEISVQLNLSPKTVETHRVNIRRKLKFKSTPELIRFAVHCASSSDL